MNAEEKKQGCNYEVNGFKVDQLGIFVEIKGIVQQEEEDGKKIMNNDGDNKKNLPQIIVVMDVSGSMGGFVATALNGAIPKAMIERGYALDTPVKVITFANDAKILQIKHATPTIHSLQSENFEGSGGTSMQNVFGLLASTLRLRSHLNLKENRAVLIIGVSDGLLDDLHESIAECTKHSATDNGSSLLNVDVVMIRLQTSATSQPDTRALACLGKFANTGKNVIYDVKTLGKTNDVVYDELKLLCRHHIQEQRTIAITYARGGLRRSPCDVPVTSLNITEDKMQGNGCCVLVPHDAQIIEVDGISYPIVFTKQPIMSAISEFCEYAKRKLELAHVMGNENDIKIMGLWFSKLNDKLTSLEEDGDSYSLASRQSLRSRVQHLKLQYFKAFKTCVRSVLETANQKKLNDLNAQQCADYLRNSSNASLAKRTAKHTQQQADRNETQSLQRETQAILTQLSSASPPTSSSDSSSASSSSTIISSFYSACQVHELYVELIDQQVQTEDISDLDLLRMFGLMGLCYQAPIRDWVDPYTFRVKKIFGGVYLLMNDLREANSVKLNGQQAELYAPGGEQNNKDWMITGVIPLVSCNKTSSIFDHVWKHGQKLLEAHTSINMRRMLAPVRSDLLGERIGLLCYIMRKNSDVSVPIPQWHQEVFQDLMYQLRCLLSMPVHYQEFEFLRNKIRTLQPLRNVLTGSNNISCIQKVLIALLVEAYSSSVETSDVVSSSSPPSLMMTQQDAYLQDTLHVLYEFDAYHAARHAFADRDARNALLKHLFQVDTAAFIAQQDIKHVVIDDDEYGDDDEDKKQEDTTNNHHNYRHMAIHHYATQTVNHHVSILEEKKNLAITQVQCHMPWVPKTRHFTGYHRFIFNIMQKEKWLSSSMKAEKENPAPQATLIPNFHISREKQLLYVVAAITCSCEQDRISGDGVCQTFEWDSLVSNYDDNQATHTYIEDTVRRYYIDDFSREISMELMRRDHAQLMTQIYLMVQDDDLDQFINALKKDIPNREHDGYKLLLDSLCKNIVVNQQPSMIQQGKLAILITGRQQDDAKVLWFHGNFDANFWSFEKYFNKERWQKIARMRRDYGVYRYRESDDPNRHGHCNSNPSDWALVIYPSLH